MVTDKIMISPKILRWARTSLHLTEEDVVLHFSKKSKEGFNLDLNLLQKLESSECLIKFSLIQEFANLYKRPLAIFFLSAPPHELLLPKDRRTVGSLEHKILSPKSVLVFRRAAYIQEVFAELASDINFDLKMPFSRISLSDDPKELAKKIRKEIDFPFEFQRDKIKNPRELFDALRDKLEEFNIFSIKASFPIEDARAFSLTEKIPNIIVINNRDGGYYGYAPKSFSLIHEFAHILLGEGGICNDFASPHIKVEKFCNEFAASFLIPDDIFFNFLQVNNLNLDEKEIDHSMEIISHAFKVSKHVLIRKLLSNGLVKEALYKEKINEWQDDFKESENKKGKFVPKITPALRSIKNNGIKYVDIVLQAKNTGKITLNNTSDYLGVGIKWVSEVEWRMQKI